MFGQNREGKVDLSDVNDALEKHEQNGSETLISDGERVVSLEEDDNGDPVAYYCEPNPDGGVTTIRIFPSENEKINKASEEGRSLAKFLAVNFHGEDPAEVNKKIGPSDKTQDHEYQLQVWKTPLVSPENYGSPEELLDHVKNDYTAAWLSRKESESVKLPPQTDGDQKLVEEYGLDQLDY